MDGGTGGVKLTEIRIKLIRGKVDKLRAFASVTIDHCLVIRDLKLIEGASGMFMAMPSRRLCDRCNSCGGKNHLRARYCNDCGERLEDFRGHSDDRGRPRLYADIAHPINQSGRKLVQDQVIAAYLKEVERSKSEDYKATTFEDLDYEAYDEV